MPQADFFSRLGLFVDENFLEADLCRHLIDEARLSPSAPGEVRSGDRSVVDEDTRKTLRVEMPEASLALLRERFVNLQPRLEQHFKTPLTGLQDPWVLLYRQGGFYHAHRDAAPAGGADAGGDHLVQATRRRRVTLVAFLNGSSREPAEGSYGGGALVLYGLLGDSRLAEVGMPLDGSPGLLVAFDPVTVHEVKPVTHGERFTVVSWFV